MEEDIRITVYPPFSKEVCCLRNIETVESSFFLRPGNEQTVQNEYFSSDISLPFS